MNVTVYSGNNNWTIIRVDGRKHVVCYNFAFFESFPFYLFSLNDDSNV